MMVLTTIGGRTLPALVRVPDIITQDHVLIPLMEGPIRPYQCLIYANQGMPPPYNQDLPSLFTGQSLHTLVQIGPSFNDWGEGVSGEEGRGESIEL